MLAAKEGILTPQQEQFLDYAGESKFISENFYFTGGTPLAAFYLGHRYSEDIDLFIETEEVPLHQVQLFVRNIEKKLRLQKVEYNTFYGLHSFQLYFPKNYILKVDFNYYPFLRIEKGMVYKNIAVDSVYDIAVNKVHTIAMKPRARDFVDVFFIIKEFGYDLLDLYDKAKAKFDWHIDPIKLGSQFYMVKDVKDFPRMIKPINNREWQDFFMEEAKKLKEEIME